MAALLVLLGGCTATGHGLPDVPATGEHRVYVTGHGRHTGLAVRAQDLPEGAWPARERFADARYIEVGWGDSLYYPAPEPGVWLGLRALAWPTDSTVHAVGVRGTLQAQFPSSEIVMLRVSREGLDRLIDFVADSHSRDAQGRAHTLAPSQTHNAIFYASPLRFHLFETCNTWVARALYAAGLPVSTRVVMAGGLMRQARALSALQQGQRGQQGQASAQGARATAIDPVQPDGWPASR